MLLGVCSLFVVFLSTCCCLLDVCSVWLLLFDMCCLLFVSCCLWLGFSCSLLLFVVNCLLLLFPCFVVGCLRCVGCPLLLFGVCRFLLFGVCMCCCFVCVAVVRYSLCNVVCLVFVVVCWW